MNNLNSILIEGNLVRDPQIRTTAKGTQVCTFTLASNRYYKQDTGLEKEVGFYDVETWAKLGEYCCGQGRKGRGVRVVGRLRQDRWNGQDGKLNSKVCIVAEHVEFRPEAKKGTGAYSAEASASAAADAEAEAAAEADVEFDKDENSPTVAREPDPITF